jgi:hypothetical protein
MRRFIYGVPGISDVPEKVTEMVGKRPHSRRMMLTQTGLSLPSPKVIERRSLGRYLFYRRRYSE